MSDLYWPNQGEISPEIYTKPDISKQLISCYPLVYKLVLLRKNQNLLIMFPQFVLPPDLPLHADGVSCNNSLLSVKVSAKKVQSSCPLYKHSSRGIHSTYSRTLTDLPLSSFVAKVELTARRFFCDNSDCRRKVFTERFDSEIQAYSRRFHRSNDLIAKIGLELGGNCGPRISKAMELLF